jgi:hypothetical protein
MSINLSYVNNENNYSSRNLIHKKIIPRNYIYIKKSNGNKSFNSKQSRNLNNIYSKIPFRRISIDNKFNTKENTIKNKLYLEESKIFQKENISSLSTTYNNIILKKDNSQNKIPLNIHNLLINMNLSEQNKFDKEEYREMLSKLIRDDYSNSIINSLLSEEEENKNFLINHKITERMRVRMIDWMIEVLSNYNCNELTYFESVNIMDRYFKICGNKKIIVQPNDLHLIGVTSMFIASKYQDISPLKLKIIQEKIAHKKLTCEEIKEKEEEITKFLDYYIGKPNIWEFINIFIEEIFYVKFNDYQIKSLFLIENYCKDIKEKSELDIKLSKTLKKLYTKNMLNLLKYICIYLAKMNCHDYILSQKKPSLLAASTILVAMKICEQINKEKYINEYFNEKLCHISQHNENDIIIVAQNILYNAQNFDILFSDLENLKKTHFNAIIELKEIK